MRMKFILLALCVFIFGNSYAQTFIPDADGYVSAPAFHQLIKKRGYQLVSAFDTLTKKPLVMVAKVMLNDKWLYMNNSAKIIPQQASADEGSASGVDFGGPYLEGPRPSGYTVEDQKFKQVSINGKYGTINKITGKEGVPAIYDAITNMEGGMVKIQLNGQTGLALASGAILKEPQYDEISSVKFGSYKNEKRFIKVLKNGRYGLLSATGTQVLPTAYTRIEDCENCNFRGNLLKIENNNKWGLALNDGQIILQPTYEFISTITSQGQLMINTGQGKEARYGLIDSLGKVLMPAVYGRLQYLSKEKLFEISDGTGYQSPTGRANLQGKVLLKPIYETVFPVNKGVFLVRQNGLMGAISVNGKIIAEPVYDRLSIDKNLPVILLKGKNKYGLLSLSGTVIFPVVYDELIPGKQNFAFKKGDKWGIMNIQGKVIINLDYDSIEPTPGYLVVSKNNKSGVITTEGKPVIPVKYDRFRSVAFLIQNGLIQAVSNGAQVFIDRYGNEYPR